MPGRSANSARRRPRRRAPEVLMCNRQKAVRVFRDRLRRLIAFVARAEDMPVASVDLAVVGPDEMARLNRRYRRSAGATDVLSFDLSDDAAAGVAAQIVVCGDVAATQGPLHGQSPQRELMLYVVHGLLHVMGYDDTAVRAAARMRARQEELLDRFLSRRR